PHLAAVVAAPKSPAVCQRTNRYRGRANSELYPSHRGPGQVPGTFSRHSHSGGRTPFPGAYSRPPKFNSANSAIRYVLGSYRIATAPEPNSSRPTSFKSTCFDSPANSVGPWPASLGCTTNSYSSINPNSANASGSFRPPTSRPLPDCRFSC